MVEIKVQFVYKPRKHVMSVQQQFNNAYRILLKEQTIKTNITTQVWWELFRKETIAKSQTKVSLYLFITLSAWVGENLYWIPINYRLNAIKYQYRA